jgi:hypothetical protein
MASLKSVADETRVNVYSFISSLASLMLVLGFSVDTRKRDIGEFKQHPQRSSHETTIEATMTPSIVRHLKWKV